MLLCVFLCVRACNPRPVFIEGFEWVLLLLIVSQYLQYGDDPLAWAQLRCWNQVVMQHTQTISEAAAGKKKYTTDIPIELIKGVRYAAASVR